MNFYTSKSRNGRSKIYLSKCLPNRNHWSRCENVNYSSRTV